MSIHLPEFRLFPAQSQQSHPQRLSGRALAVVAVLAGIVLGLQAGRGSMPQDQKILRLDVNTAPKEALAALPNLGPARLRAIEAARSIRPLQSITDLDRRVAGIGPMRASELAPHLRFPDP